MPSHSALAWSLKTHAWIAQQVLNDALDDGRFGIAGNSYAVPPHLLSSLAQHPDRFRMGALGPDVFPDPIVGQTTTHPGVEGGWQADQWLEFLLNRSNTAEELAFSYGFITHGAGDIFAHTYVNAYAGDIFILTDDEREVELRHFVLEKYIESKTPTPLGLTGVAIDWENDFGTATSFARDALIMDSAVSRENARAGTGYHLTAMFQVRERVADLERAVEKVVSQLTSWSQKYFLQELELQSGLTSAKLTLDAASLALDGAERLLQLNKQVVDAKLAILKRATEIVAQHPELISAQLKLLSEQTKVAADAAVAAIQIAKDVQNTISGAQNAIGELRGNIAQLACYVLVYPPAVRECKKKVNKINEKIQEWESKISLAKERQRAAEDIANAAARLRDEIKAALNKLEAELDEATKGIAEGTYEAAVEAARIVAKAQQEVVDQARRAVEEAKKLVARIEKELDELSKITNPIREFINRYNPITLVLKKWISDINVASEEYIKASHRAGLKMLQSQGNPLEEYLTWHSCYGQVFMAIPKEVGELGCLGRKYLDEINGLIDGVLEDLPEVLQWLVAPTWKLKQVTEKAVKEALEFATLKIVAFLTDDRTAEFLSLIAHPQNADRSRLVDVYGRDSSGKNLLLFPDVAALVDRDLALTDGKLDPARFAPLQHAVTLSKLAVLDPAELNRMVRDLVGESGVDGRQLFQSGRTNFSLLLGVVRSLDGNHQWQAYGLPYPRRSGTNHDHPSRFKYGYNGYAESGKGLLIWRDRFFRERVFNVLFPAPVIGVLQERSELRWPDYRFPSCPQNPFPATQDQRGEIQSSDQTCVAVARPDQPLTRMPTVTAADYQDRYFRCGREDAAARHTVVGPFRNRFTAEAVARYIRHEYPDMHIEVWRPTRQTTYWPVVVAACVGQEIAAEARDIALRRRLDSQITIDRAPLPWTPVLAGDSDRPSRVGGWRKRRTCEAGMLCCLE